MDEAIKLLREQAILCSRLNELLDKLTESLKNFTHETQEIVQQINPLVADLSKNSTKTQEFLQAANVQTFGEFIKAANDSVEKEVAERLSKKVVDLQEKMVSGMKVAAGVLVNCSNFVNFNLNVLSQTSASPTYGAEAQTATNANRRIFDANI